MACLDRTAASVAISNRVQLIATILEAADSFTREELRELGDAFHQKASALTSKKSWRSDLPEPLNREVWLEV